MSLRRVGGHHRSGDGGCNGIGCRRGRSQWGLHQFSHHPSDFLDRCGQGLTATFMVGGASYSTTVAAWTDGPDQTVGSDWGSVNPGQGFCADGTYQVRFRFELGKPSNVLEVNSSTWHNGGRHSQNIWLYDAVGGEPGLNLNPPGDAFDNPLPPMGGTDPATVGWTYLGMATTAVSDGQLAVGFQQINGIYRYLLFDIGPPGFSAYGAYYGEVDILTLPEPSLVDLFALGGIVLWARRQAARRASELA